MRLLVTGGAGYIGSIVAQHLLRDGHEVVVLDDLQRGHRDAVPEGAQFADVSLSDAQGTKDVLAQGFDGVLHFAALALVAESVAHPERYYRGNVVASLNLLDAMRETGVERLVFSSTCAVYGEPDVVPMREDIPAAPVNSYGNSKLAVDRMIADECRAHGLGASSLRYFNVAGASGPLGEDHEPETHLIPLVLRAAAGRTDHVKIMGTDYPTRDGTAVRDYIHVEDLATAHALALGALEPGRHRIYNLGTGHGYSVREVIDAARRVTGREIPAIEEARRPGDPAALVASADRAREELGWTPRARPRLDDRRRLGLAPGAPRRLRLNPLRERLERGREHRVRRRGGIEHHEPLRLGRGERVVGLGHGGEERRVLELEPVGGLAPAAPVRARPCDGSIRSSSVRSGFRAPVANSLIAPRSATPSPRPAPW